MSVTAASREHAAASLRNGIHATDLPDEVACKMVLCVRHDLRMRTGKIAAQCAHAALGLVDSIRHPANRRDMKRLSDWEAQGHAKVVLRVDNLQDLLTVETAARQANLPTYLVLDAGRTQVEPGSETVLAIGPATSSELNPITGHLKLL